MCLSAYKEGSRSLDSGGPNVTERDRAVFGKDSGTGSNGALIFPKHHQPFCTALWSDWAGGGDYQELDIHPGQVTHYEGSMKPQTNQVEMSNQ